jgi:hypothetical protein
MTIDQLINLHDEVVNEAEAHFPKPLGRHQIKGKPQLTIVENVESKPYLAEDYLKEKLGDFLKKMEKITIE